MAHGPAILRLFSTFGAAAALSARGSTAHNYAPGGAQPRTAALGSRPRLAAYLDA
jgi:hypothetical protein